jgi:hypothetical protein
MISNRIGGRIGGLLGGSTLLQLTKDSIIKWEKMCVQLCLKEWAMKRAQGKDWLIQVGPFLNHTTK